MGLSLTSGGSPVCLEGTGPIVYIRQMFWAGRPESIFHSHSAASREMKFVFFRLLLGHFSKQMAKKCGLQLIILSVAAFGQLMAKKSQRILSNFYPVTGRVATSTTTMPCTLRVSQWKARTIAISF